MKSYDSSYGKIGFSILGAEFSSFVVAVLAAMTLIYSAGVWFFLEDKVVAVISIVVLVALNIRFLVVGLKNSKTELFIAYENGLWSPLFPLKKSSGYFVPWSEIKEVKIQTLEKGDFVRDFLVVEPKEIQKYKSLLKRKIIYYSRSDMPIKDKPLSFDISELSTTPKTIERGLKEYFPECKFSCDNPN